MNIRSFWGLSKNMKRNLKGFTLIELLIVITIIAILASIVFVALDPLTRFRQARDSRRWADASALLSAIKVNQIDNGGFYLSTTTAANYSVNSMVAGTVYMIGTVNTGCDKTCITSVSGGTSGCVDLSALVTGGYLGSVPISPNGVTTWTSATTGYTLQKDSNGIITVRACEGEQGTEIKVAR